MFRYKTKFVVLIATCVSVVSASTVTAQTIADENRLAAGYYSRGQWEETVSAFQALIARYPNSEESTAGHFFLGEALMQTGRYDEAYHAYQVFIQRKPKHLFVPRATFRMGEAAYRLDRRDQALRMLEIYVRDNPHDALNEYALAYLGEIRVARKEPQLAQRAYETVLRLYPSSHLSNKCRLGLAKAFQMQGADAQAMRFFQVLIDEPGNPLAGEAHLQIATIQLNCHDLPAAQGHLISALHKLQSPESQSEAAYWLARTYVAEDNYNRAYELLVSAAENENPEKLASAIYFDLAVAATRLEKETVAQTWLTRLLENYPENELADDALHLQIELTQKSGSKNEIGELVARFVKHYPHSRLKANVLETAGRTCYANQEYAESVKIFQKLLTDDLHVDDSKTVQDHSNWQYLLALSQLGLNDFSSAEKSLGQINFPDASDKLKSYLQIGLANARFGQRKFSEAIPNYRNYLRLTDAAGAEVLRARTELTVCLAESGLWQEVIGAFDDLHRLHEEESVVLETAEYLAEKANNAKQTTHAALWYEYMATPGNPLDTIARGLSGFAWIKMEAGEEDVAMAAFERLVNECPDSEFTLAAAMTRAKYFDDHNDHKQAAQMYRVVIHRFGESDMANVARLRRAYALQKSGRSTDLHEAQTLLNEYLALPGEIPAKDEALYQLGWVNTDLKNFDDSHENFRWLIKKYPHSKYWPDAVLRMARHETKQNNFSVATELIQSLTDRTEVAEPILSRALYLKGEIAAKQNEWEIVSSTMHQLLKQSADVVLKTKANYWMAESLYRQKQFTAAGELFQFLRQDSNGLDEQLKPWICLRHAQCLGQQDEWSSALEIAETGKAKFPKFVADYEFDFVRARGLEAAGKLNDCRTAYQMVIDSTQGGDTETAAISQWRIAETFFHQENYPDAIEAYYKVDSLFAYDNWRSAAIFQAGKCQEHLNNWEHAHKLYARLIEQFPDSHYAEAAQQRLDRVLLLAKVQKESNPQTQSR